VALHRFRRQDPKKTSRARRTQAEVRRLLEQFQTSERHVCQLMAVPRSRGRHRRRRVCDFAGSQLVPSHCAPRSPRALRCDTTTSPRRLNASVDKSENCLFPRFILSEKDATLFRRPLMLGAGPETVRSMKTISAILVDEGKLEEAKETRGKMSMISSDPGVGSAGQGRRACKIASVLQGRVSHLS